ncbi:MAG: MarC family protein [Proteobacteria bacterium]|nr:MarC family protein [Pseudomonadota bacterium]
MMSWDYIDFLYKTFIAFFVIIDPFAIIPVFINYTLNDSRTLRNKTAFKATLIAGIVLLIFALTGDKFLEFLGISHGSFRIAGGILLMFAGIDMVIAKNSGIRSTTKQENEEAVQKSDISVFPLAIPLIAGPGALTTLVISMGEVEGVIFYQISIILIVLFVLFLTYLCLMSSNLIFKILGVTGTNVLTRIFGIIIAAIAIEYIVKGLRDSFPALGGC